jgi:hypothetical protein
MQSTTGTPAQQRRARQGTMITNQIHLYNHVEDAWEANLADWVDQRSLASLEGHETWLVTESFFQASWIRRKALSLKRSLFGIQVFDRRSLREHLGRTCGLPDGSLGRDAFQLLIDTAAVDTEPGYTASGSLLNALDQLGASGAVDRLGPNAVREMLGVPEALQPALKAVVESVYWAPRLDALLLERVTCQSELHVGLFGFDPQSVCELNLLLAAAKRAARCDIWIAQPLGKEDLGFNWISILEQALRTEATICPAGQAPRPFEEFLGHWQGGGRPRRIDLPEIIVGKRWFDQVEGIARRIAKALVEREQSVLVVVPENSPTGNAVVHALISHGIAVADEIRETRSVPLAAEVQVAIAQFFSRDRTPEDFLKVVRCLLRSQDCYRAFREALMRSFDSRQIRSVPALITDELRERFPWLCDLDKALEPMPEKAGWNELCRFWDALAGGISTLANAHSGVFAEIAFPANESLWRETGPLLERRVLTSQLFLQFVTRSVLARPREPHPESHHRYAKVCATTAAKAHGTSWDCIILADSVADAWPVAPAPNPLLSEEEKIRLRQQGHFILTASEQRAIQEERYLQVAYAARKHLILARYAQDEQGVESVANNLSTFSEEFLKASIARVQPEAVRIQDDPTARFAEICESRTNPGKPFDEFFLNFKGIELPARAWHPSELESVFKTPGTFAFRLMFDCGRELDRGFIRSASMTLGRLTHRLLQRAFAGSGQFSMLEKSAQWNREEERIRLSHCMEMALESMRREFVAHGSDLWWESILGKAFAFASQILDHVSERFEEGRWYQSEATLTGALKTSAGALKLEGRTDLILSDRERLDSATVTICDFKTSKRSPRFDADSGENLQFLGYRLLAEVNGALRTEILIVRPDSIKPLELPPNEALIGLTELLARLQETRSFGRRPPEKWEVTEKLPIATLPIDPGVLQRKLKLTWN